MGRVSRQQASLNRERVVAAAARLFRERGLNGIGIAELMAEAGLTHGGFYRQFGSKEAVAGEACGYAMERSVAGWREIAGREADAGLTAIVDHYLARNEDEPRCAISALAGDVARETEGSPVRAAFTGGVRDLAGVLASCLAEGSPEERQERALGLLAALAGAVALARAVDDPVLAQALREAVRKLASP